VWLWAIADNTFILRVFRCLFLFLLSLELLPALAIPDAEEFDVKLFVDNEGPSVSVAKRRGDSEKTMEYHRARRSAIVSIHEIDLRRGFTVTRLRIAAMSSATPNAPPD
jgi:hypothetical protein